MKTFAYVWLIAGLVLGIVSLRETYNLGRGRGVAEGRATQYAIDRSSIGDWQSTSVAEAHNYTMAYEDLQIVLQRNAKLNEELTRLEKQRKILVPYMQSGSLVIRP